MNQTNEKKARNYVENPPTASEITKFFWEEISEKIDVDGIVYDIISDFDHHFENEDGTFKNNWFNKECGIECDEKDSLREEVLDAIGFNY